MEITQELVKEYFDYKDGGLYRIVKTSNSVKIGDRFGSVIGTGYRMGHFLNKLYYEHRLIFMYHFGYFPKEIDHINRNKFDNHIENLRDCTFEENQQNKNRRIDNVSGVVGVYWSLQKRKWKAEIMYNGIHKHLGFFRTKETAKLIRRCAELKYHGTAQAGI